MAEIKFRCPECTQKIAVPESAAGVKIDCPTCHSRLVIPRSPILPVDVLIPRKLAIVGGSADAVYEELQKAEVQAEKVADELRQLRADSSAAAQKARQETEELLTANKALQSELEMLRPIREQFAAAQKDLATAAAAQRIELSAAQDAANTLRKELTELQATYTGTLERLDAVSGQLGVMQSERDSFAKTAAESTDLRGQLADTQRDLASARSSAEITIEAHRAQLDAAKGIEAGVRAELAGMQTRHTQAEERLAELTAKFTALEAENVELTGLLEQLVPLRAELARAQTDLCNMCEVASQKACAYELQLATAKSTEAELRAALADLQAKHAAAEKQTAEQVARLGDMEKRAVELQTEAAEARSRGVSLATAQDGMKRALEQGEQAAKEREEALTQAQNAQKALRDEADALKAEVAEGQRRHAAITHGFSALKQERAELAAELSALKKERDDAAALVAEKSKTVEKLIPAMESAKGELARLREETTGAAIENGRISAALEKASAEREELRAHSKKLEADAEAGRTEIAQLKQALISADAAAKGDGAKLQSIANRIESATALAADKDAALREALAKAEQHRTAHLAAQEQLQKAERPAGEATERASKIEAEKAALTAEISRKSAELDAMKVEAAKAVAPSSQTKPQPKATKADAATPTEREKTLETERDALASALERAKQHVGVLQARRDMLRDEVATLRARLGIGGKITSGDEKPIAK